ncbi:hypothetical protein HY933_02510 [Candidatus Falkowbacteria bacterium]|nr:hypothetical protein [Candidatus Falkowbacteria bacterium]
MPQRFSLDEPDEIPISDALGSLLLPDRRRRRLTMALSALAGFIVILGIWHFLRQINLPAEEQLAKWQAQSQDAGLTNFNLNADQDLLALNSADTDSDGLSDYEEIYIYSTSIYLADTDSDGESDAVETQNGTDPLCPKGEECVASPPTTTTTASATDHGTLLDALDSGSSDITTDQSNGNILADSIRSVMIEQGISAAELNKYTNEQLVALYQQYQNQTAGGTNTVPAATTGTGGTPSPDELRALLLQAGFSQSQVDNYSDKQLLEVYQKISTGEGTTGATTNSNTNISADTQKLRDSLSAMTGAQIRQLLQQSGFNKDILAKYTDEQLRALLLEVSAQ